jgi:prevent-host-death family protein
MTTIGFYEARTRLSELLDQVARGKQILITRHGKPAAVLGPAPAAAEPDVTEVIAAMKALRRGNRLGRGLSARDLIDEGRRF